jgi:hypothetical protein
MSRVGPGELLGLPAELGRLIHEFLFRPGLGAHPERLALPSPFDQAGEVVQAVVIERGLLGPAAGSVDAEACLAQFDWQSPLHRIALLPRDILETLSWYLGLAACRDRLRRIVMRDELRALHARGLSAGHLAFVYQLPEQAGTRGLSDSRRIESGGQSSAPGHTGMDGRSSAPESMRSEPVQPAWPERILAEGWSILEAVRALLPDPIAVRYQLKLPPDRPSDASSPERVAPGDFERVRRDAQEVAPGGPLFEWVRSRVVAAWRADFDATLLALARPSGR